MSRHFFKHHSPDEFAEEDLSKRPPTWSTEFTALDGMDDESRAYDDYLPSAHVAYHPESERTLTHFPGTPGTRLRQGAMFVHSPGEIYSAFADPSMRSAVPTLLGLAANEHRRITGSSYSLPMHDSSLSPHSSKMVRKLQDRGVDIPANPDNATAEATNAASFHRLWEARSNYPAGKFQHTDSSRPFDTVEVRPQEVNEARHRVRQLLSKPGLPEAPRGPQYEQMRMF